MKISIIYPDKFNSLSGYSEIKKSLKEFGFNREGNTFLIPKPKSKVKDYVGIGMSVSKCMPISYRVDTESLLSDSDLVFLFLDTNDKHTMNVLNLAHKLNKKLVYVDITNGN